MTTTSQQIADLTKAHTSAHQDLLNFSNTIDNRIATNNKRGLIRIATQKEVEEGTATDIAVSPNSLSSRIGLNTNYPHVYKADGLFPVPTINNGQLVINTELDFKWNLRGLDYLLTDFSTSERTLSVTNYGVVIFSESGFSYIPCANENEVAAIESTHSQMVIFDIVASTLERVPNWFDRRSNGIKTTLSYNEYAVADNKPSQYKAVPFVLPRTPAVFLQGITDLMTMVAKSHETHIGIRAINRRLINLYFQRTVHLNGDGITVEWGYML